jgi:flagellar export protein FliJ
MRKFRFPLRSVETVRAMLELRAREAFTEALHAFHAAEDRLRQAREQRRKLEGILVASRGATLRPADQVSYLNAYHAELARERQAAQESETAKAELDKRREVWTAARRDLRVIENLEVKAREVYRRELEYEEQKILDDRTNATASRAPLLMS